MKIFLSAYLLAALALLGGCSDRSHDTDKQMITAVMSGAAATLSIDGRYIPPTRVCLVSTTPPPETTIKIGTQVDGQIVWIEHHFNIDPPGLVATMVPQDKSVPTMVLGGMNYMCFAAAAMVPYERGQFGLYVIQLGTLHIQNIEFVNEYGDPNETMGPYERSYHLTYSIDPPPGKATGQGYQGTFTTTCIMNHSAAENRWYFKSC